MNPIAKSWCWQSIGEPESLILKEKLLRDLSPDEILVKNTAIGLNPIDWKLIGRGDPDWLADHTPGVDGVGTVVSVGYHMQHLQIGQRICYHTNLKEEGSFSTHTIVNGNAIMHIPDSLSDIVAATFPCPGLTAFQAFNKVKNLKGTAVLVNGGGGSVGFFLTQLLLKAGAHVYVTCSSIHHPLYIELGVSHVFDYKGANWREELLASLPSEKLHVAYDLVSPESASALVPLIGYYGHLVPILGRVEGPLVPPTTTCISIHEIALGAIHRYGSENQIRALMYAGESMLVDLAAGVLRYRDVSLNSFVNLPHHLSRLKKQPSSLKYVITL